MAKKLKRICEALGVERKGIVEVSKILGIEVNDDPNWAICDDDVLAILKQLYPSNYEDKKNLVYAPRPLSPEMTIRKDVEKLIFESVEKKWQTAKLDLDEDKIRIHVAKICMLACASDRKVAEDIGAIFRNDNSEGRQQQIVKNIENSNSDFRVTYRKEINAYQIYLENQDKGEDVIKLVENALK